MGKLLKMDLYRMWKSMMSRICLILAFALAVFYTPMLKIMFDLANKVSPEFNEIFPAEQELSGILSDPFLLLNTMLIMLSLCFFFYADLENGYIKNIAGQMPLKGFTVLSKFIAAFLHNLIFVAAGIIGNTIGTVFVQRIVFDDSVADSVRILVLKILLLQSLCAILLLVVCTFRSKSVGMILAVLFGLGLTSLIYMGISQVLKPIFGQATDISKYMPDAVMNEKPLQTVKALAVAFVTGGIFLPLAIRVFDRKDVK